jgi:hypothetical protein
MACVLKYLLISFNGPCPIRIGGLGFAPGGIFFSWAWAEGKQRYNAIPSNAVTANVLRIRANNVVYIISYLL